MESNHPGVGLPPPAGFEDRMGHQTPAAPASRLSPGHIVCAIDPLYGGELRKRCLHGLAGQASAVPFPPLAKAASASAALLKPSARTTFPSASV
jgi:hypothetical protein